MIQSMATLRTVAGRRHQELYKHLLTDTVFRIHAGTSLLQLPLEEQLRLVRIAVEQRTDIVESTSTLTPVETLDKGKSSNAAGPETQGMASGMAHFRQTKIPRIKQHSLVILLRHRDTPQTEVNRQ